MVNIRVGRNCFALILLIVVGIVWGGGMGNNLGCCVVGVVFIMSLDCCCVGIGVGVGIGFGIGNDKRSCIRCDGSGIGCVCGGGGGGSVDSDGLFWGR